MIQICESQNTRAYIQRSKDLFTKNLWIQKYWVDQRENIRMIYGWSVLISGSLLLAPSSISNEDFCLAIFLSAVQACDTFQWLRKIRTELTGLLLNLPANRNHFLKYEDNTRVGAHTLLYQHISRLSSFDPFSLNALKLVITSWVILVQDKVVTFLFLFLFRVRLSGMLMVMWTRVRCGPSLQLDPLLWTSYRRATHTQIQRWDTRDTSLEIFNSQHLSQHFFFFSLPSREILWKGNPSHSACLLWSRPSSER